MNMSGIKIGDLAAAVMKELNAYEKLTQEEIEKAIDETAKETVKDLKSSSPKGKSRKKGTYAKGWTSKITSRGRGAYGRTVHAGKGSSLTHLLEYGHALRRGGRTVGRAAARPHIAAAEQQAAKLFQEKIVKGLEK